MHNNLKRLMILSIATIGVQAAGCGETTLSSDKLLEQYCIDTGRTINDDGECVCEEGSVWNVASMSCEAECSIATCAPIEHAIAKSSSRNSDGECQCDYDCETGYQKDVITSGSIVCRLEDPSNNKCEEEGARKCDNNSIMLCTDDKWTVEKKCEDNETCNDGTFECIPNEPETCDENGAKRCSSDATQIETCTEGVWAGEACEGELTCVTTDEGPLCAVCENDDTRCVVENGISLLSTCVNYQWDDAQACLDLDPDKQVCDANPGKSCVNVMELLLCPEEGNVACQDVYGQEYAVICEDGVVTEASGVCEEGLVCYVPEGGCTTPDECGNEKVGAGEDCEEGMMGEATCASLTGDANASGDLACSSCKYDLSACLYCGDGIVNNSEVCDGSVPEGVTCTTVMDDGKVYTGTLSCKDDCTFDISNCTEDVVEDCTPENCTTDDPNATAVCNENVCNVTCNENYIDVEGVCTTTACNAEDTQCGDNTFYKCSSGELKAFPIPTDGKHYVCDVTKDDGWVEVECTEASHCTTDDSNATATCEANVCVVTCNDTYTDVDGVCTAIVCTIGDNTCNGANVMVCNATGTGYDLVEACTTTDSNATATCEANACKVTCNDTYTEVGGVCTAVVCEANSKICNETNDGLKVCNATGTGYDEGDACTPPENATAACDSGVCGFECDPGFIKNTTEDGCDREILACNFQGIAAEDGAFGYVALNGKTKDDYQGRLVCIDKTDSTKIVILDAIYNGDRDTNVEFGVLDLTGINAGAYNCTFEFKLATSSSWYACQGVDYSDTWATPVLIAGDDYSVLPESGWYREYSVQMCVPKSLVCIGVDTYHICADDGMSYGDEMPCVKPDHAKTMACNANVCEVATCEGNWSVKEDRSGCECIGENIFNGSECIAKCTLADTKCEGNTFFKCEDSGLVTEKPKPTDGQIYICNASEGGWKAVDCTEASHCTPIPDHATMTCNSDHECEVASCDGNWSVNTTKDACECTSNNIENSEGECVAKCTSADTRCDGDNYYQCEETGLVTTTPKPTDGNHYICKDASGWEAVACTEDSHCTIAPEHATMACNAENVCEVATCEGNWSVNTTHDACECTGDYMVDGNECVPKCPTVATLKKDGLIGSEMNDTNTYIICNANNLRSWNDSNKNEENLIIYGNLEIDKADQIKLSHKGNNIVGVKYGENSKANISIINNEAKTVPLFVNNESSLKISNLSLAYNVTLSDNKAHAALMNISNDLKIFDVEYSGNLTGSSGITNVGGLIGETNANSSIVFNNINLNNVVVSIGENGSCLKYGDNIGGLIGEANGDVTIDNVNVANIRMHASKNVAGLIGSVSKQCSIIIQNNTSISTPPDGIVAESEGAAGAIGYMDFDSSSLTVNGLDLKNISLKTYQYAGGIVAKGYTEPLSSSEGEESLEQNSLTWSVSEFKSSGVTISRDTCGLSSATFNCYFGGMFGALMNGTGVQIISNINNNIKNIDADSCDYVGGMIGYINGELNLQAKDDEQTELKGVFTNNVAYISARKFIGGMVGYLSGKLMFDGLSKCDMTRINNTVATIAIKDTSGVVSGDTGNNVGGMFGYVDTDSDVTIKNVTNRITESISGKNYVGGLIGQKDSKKTGMISFECIDNDVEYIEATNDNLGGMVGLYHGTSTFSINTISNVVRNLINPSSSSYFSALIQGGSTDSRLSIKGGFIQNLVLSRTVVPDLNGDKFSFLGVSAVKDNISNMVNYDFRHGQMGGHLFNGIQCNHTTNVYFYKITSGKYSNCGNSTVENPTLTSPLGFTWTSFDKDIGKNIYLFKDVNLND